MNDNPVAKLYELLGRAKANALMMGNGVNTKQWEAIVGLVEQAIELITTPPQEEEKKTYKKRKSSNWSPEQRKAAGERLRNRLAQKRAMKPVDQIESSTPNAFDTDTELNAYVCIDCAHDWLSETEPTQCPNCDGHAFRRR